MEVSQTEIADVRIITPKVFGDDRGFFMETFRDGAFRQQVADVTFVQDNHSRSRKGVLRGLHYQILNPQGKLVRVTWGRVYDVAVDIRRSSPDFGKWVGVILSDENRQMLWVPPGFAHGFYVLSDAAEFIYKCTDYYAPEHERTILWDDPAIGIHWPVREGDPVILSDKDARGAYLQDAEVFA